MPTCRVGGINQNGGLRGVKRWGGDKHRQLIANKLYKEDRQQTENFEVNIYDQYNTGEITDFQIREFIKRLGKDKCGGILNYKVILHKKFVKYLPKKARVFQNFYDKNQYFATNH